MRIKQSELKARESEAPPSPPRSRLTPSNAKAPRERESSEGRPSSAGHGGRARRSASHEPPKRPSTAESHKPSTTERHKPSEGELWATSRMDSLRKELVELDKCSAADRKRGLRKLQRELHPDKQPPELREHAQPLFHLVQREWEVDAARARDSQESGATGGA